MSEVPLGLVGACSVQALRAVLGHYVPISSGRSKAEVPKRRVGACLGLILLLRLGKVDGIHA